MTFQLTQGGINHNYICLPPQKCRAFFPEDSFGGSNKNNPGKLFSIYLEGLNQSVKTDIAKGKFYFRDRSFPPRFIEHHNLKAGDEIVIEKLSDYEYKIYPHSLPSHLAANSLLNEDQEIDRILEELVSQGFFNRENLDCVIEKTQASITERKGQPKFRSELLTAYQGQCAITGFNAGLALEAAHIYPYQGEYTNETWNGLLLRADIHTLFDLKLITVDPKTKQITIAPELKSTGYRYLEGKKLRIPEDKTLYLKTLAVLKWHYKQCKWV